MNGWKRKKKKKKRIHHTWCHPSKTTNSARHFVVKINQSRNTKIDQQWRKLRPINQNIRAGNQFSLQVNINPEYHMNKEINVPFEITVHDP